MGFFDDLLEGGLGEPVWKDMFKWRCPKCGRIISAQKYPGPGEEDAYWSKPGSSWYMSCYCKYEFGVDPGRVYARHSCCGIGTLGRNELPDRYVSVICNCNLEHKVSNVRWESSVEPLYFEKAQKSGKSLSVELSRPQNQVSNLGGNNPKRIIQRRIVQTSEGTFAEETIIEF